MSVSVKANAIEKAKYLFGGASLAVKAEAIEKVKYPAAFGSAAAA